MVEVKANRLRPKSTAIPACMCGGICRDLKTTITEMTGSERSAKALNVD